MKGEIVMLNGLMTTFFPQLNCPPISRTNFRTKVINPSMAIQVSSVLVHSEGRNLPDSKSIITGPNTASTRCQTPLFAQENSTVGVIGGLSPMTTLIFLEKLVFWSSRDGKDSVPFVVCNDPVIKRDPLVHSNLVNGKLDVGNESVQKLVVDSLRRKMVFLEQSGAKCIVMPCYLCHVWQDEASKGCSIPFPNVGDCVVQELKEANLKPLEARSNVRIGVLTTDATLVGGFYQEKLRHQGFEGVLPDKPTMEHIVLPVAQAMKRRDIEGARNLLRIAIHVLLMKGANSVILAADEFQGLLPHDDPILRKCIDPMDALARSTINMMRPHPKREVS